MEVNIPMVESQVGHRKYLCTDLRGGGIIRRPNLNLSLSLCNLFLYLHSLY